MTDTTPVPSRTAVNIMIDECCLDQLATEIGTVAEVLRTLYAEVERLTGVEGDAIVGAIAWAYERDALKRTVADQAAALAGKQARIDALMLEYCPDDMTPEQLEEWGRNQQPIPKERQEALTHAMQRPAFDLLAEVERLTDWQNRHAECVSELRVTVTEQGAALRTIRDLLEGENYTAAHCVADDALAKQTP